MARRQSFQRIGFLTMLPGFLEQRGVDAAQVMADAGLEPAALQSPDGVILYAKGAHLLALSAERTGLPHIGLLLGDYIKPDMLGAIGQLMHHAPTLGCALRDYTRTQHQNAHGSISYLLEDADTATFGYGVYEPDLEGVPCIYDIVAVAMCNVISALIGVKQPSGMKVLMSRLQPEDMTPYHKAFRIPVAFDAGQTAVQFPRAWLDRPVPGADFSKRAELEHQVRQYWASGDHDVLTQVRRALWVGLLNGETSAGAIADTLGLGKRALHRRLAAEGTNHQQMLDKTRIELARQLLLNTRMSLSSISQVLRFTEHAVFTRSFERWMGNSPNQWRHEQKTSVFALT